MIRIVVNAQLALGAVDHGGVILGRVVGPGGGHGADHAACHLIDADGVVVHADQVPVRAALIQRGELGGGAHHVLPQQELNQVGLVDAQVGHGAHGGLGLVEEPGVLPRGDAPGLGPAVAEGGAEGDDLADLSLGDHLLGQLVSLGQPLVLADHQKLALLVGDLHHLLAVGEGDGHGLFAEDVLAGLEGFDGQLRVGVVGGAYGNRVDCGIRQQFFCAVIGLAAVFGGHVLGTGLGGIEEAHQLAVGVVRVLGNMSHLGDLAAAQNTDFQHGKASPQTISRRLLLMF